MKKFMNGREVIAPAIKINLKMRLTIFLLILAMFKTEANNYAQNTKITLDLTNVSVEKVLDEIENATEFKFLFNRKSVDVNKLISVKFKDARVKRILNSMFKNMPVSFEVFDKQIILKTTAPDNIINLRQHAINGVVKDENGVPLPGASVLEKGTSNGTSTDIDGRFSFNVSNNAVLVISYVGYFSQEVSVSGKSTFNVTLQPDTEQLDAVVVTGIRSSYAAAEKAKRNANQVVDGISSEAIGKLPDPNIAEALQRVTGVQIQREDASGSYVSIRGLDPTFTKVTINGQSQTAARSRSGETGYDLSVLGSSIASSLEVFKSPTAKMEEGGVGGTVNIVKKRPFDIGGTKFSLGIKPTYEVESENLNPRIDFFYNMLSSDKVGFSVSAFYLKRDFKRIRVRGESSPEAFDLNGSEVFVQDRVRARLNQDQNKQFSVSSTFQYKPSDNFNTYLEVTLGETNGFDTRYDNEIRIRTSHVSPVGAVANEDGFLTTVPVTDFRNLGGGGFTNDTQNRLFSLASGFDWQLGDKTNLKFEFARSENKRTNDDHPGFGLGFGLNGVSGDFDPTPADPDDVIAHLVFDGPGDSGFNLVDIAGIPSFGDVNNYVPGTSVGSNGTLEKTSAREYSFRADIERKLGNGFAKSLEFGFKATNRKESERNFRRAPNDRTGAVPGNISDFIVPITDYADNNIIPGFTYYAVNVRPFVSGIFNDPANFTLRTDEVEDEFFAERKIFSGYGMLNFGKEDGAVRGNVGLRLVNTRTETRGFASLDGLRRIEINPDGSIDGFEPVIANNNYTKALPSLNVAVDLTDNLVARFAGATVMRRPEIRELTPYFGLGIEFDEITQNPVLDPENTDGFAGNPNLDPFEANQLDVSLEYYFSKGGLFSAGFFYKDVKNFITQGFELRDLVITDPSTGNPEDVTVNVETYKNGGGATVSGLELAYQQSFTFLPGFLSNLGTALNYTLTNSETDETGETLDGTSKNSFNATVYYEKNNYGLRLAHNYRSEYRTGSGGGGQFRKAAGFWDASAYCGLFDGKLKLTFNAVNLTDKAFLQDIFVTNGGSSPNGNNFSDYELSGRQFLMGLIYSF